MTASKDTINAVYAVVMHYVDPQKCTALLNELAKVKGNKSFTETVQALSKVHALVWSDTNKQASLVDTKPISECDDFAAFKFANPSGSVCEPSSVQRYTKTGEPTKPKLPVLHEVSDPKLPMSKKCQSCNARKPSTRRREIYTKNYQGPCGDSFCYYSCDSSSCRPIHVTCCDGCVPKLGKESK